MRTITGLFLVAAIVIFGIAGAYWWANTVPRKPAEVSPDAVFLWAPYVGLPAPKRGWWLVCWEEAGHDWCKLSGIKGEAEYQGEFVSYPHKRLIPADQLKIDPTMTREHKIWVGDALVPLVYLKNGEILIPATKYQEGVRALNQQSR